ncbi:MAG TPA: FAD-dependent oxidoreductase [Pseudomonadales bacterium]|nr:FAD-dependent oxidoreductase [Pseudomonadales bacterium]
MTHHKYLIIGGGMAADAATAGIREVDREGSIGLIGAESDPPYNRPALSKALWKDQSLETIWRDTADRGVELHLGHTATTIDPRSRTVTDAAGNRYSYEKLLLATGATPRHLGFGGDDVIYYQTTQDYRRLRELSANKRDFAIIGGGFIGSEVAAALAMHDRQVTMLFPDEGICWRLFPPGLSRFLNDSYRKKGVRVLNGHAVHGMRKEAGRFVLEPSSQATNADTSVAVDAIVAGIGVVPNVELAEQAGLETKNGIVVDAYLRTSNPDIHAAGDVAFFHESTLNESRRVEHEDNANTMGRAAGRNMAGAGERYDHLPFFYSDLFELGYEAVGLTDSRLQMVEDWREPYHEGVVYYLDKGRVRGVLLWNVWDQVPNARRLIAEAGPFRPEDLKGRLPA